MDSNFQKEARFYEEKKSTFHIQSVIITFTASLHAITSKGGTASGTPYPAFTDEEAERVEKYIRSCDTLFLAMDDDVKRVCEEEAALYFGNVQTLDDAVEHIQNRVSIIISEKS